MFHYFFDYIKTPKQYYKKHVINIGSKYGTIIDGNSRLENIEILKNDFDYGKMTPENRFLNGVEIPEKILCDCDNQKKLLDFFMETRYRAYENDICPTTYWISEPYAVFDPDRIYGYELLTHILKYKNITICNEVKHAWGLKENIKDATIKQEFYPEEEWRIKYKQMWKDFRPYEDENEY